MGEGGGVGERVGEAERVQAGHRPTDPRDDAGGDGAGARHAHLLADDGPHAGLERIPRAGHPEPGPGAHGAGQHGIGGEALVGGRRVAVEGEDLPGSLHDVDEAVDVREVGAQQEVVVAAAASARAHRARRRP